MVFGGPGAGHLARFDGELKAAAPAPRTLAADLRRSGAMAHCLSAGEGWRDAAKLLGGAFAPLGRGTDEAKT